MSKKTLLEVAKEILLSEGKKLEMSFSDLIRSLRSDNGIKKRLKNFGLDPSYIYFDGGDLVLVDKTILGYKDIFDASESDQPGTRINPNLKRDVDFEKVKNIVLQHINSFSRKK
jgi:hypothetical protein